MQKRLRWYGHVKPATCRPCVLAFVYSGAVPAFTCDCPSFVCVFMQRRKVDLCVSASSRTMLALVLLLHPISGNMAVNTLASKRSVLIGNAAIVRKRRVIHNKSTCVCLRLPVAVIYADTLECKVDLWPA